MLKKIIYKIFHAKQRGIALLFSLTFLALLMVLALAFASNAMIEQKVAYYGNSMTSSRMLADSQLARIIAQLKIGHDLKYSRNSKDPDKNVDPDDGTSFIFDYPQELETLDTDGSYIFDWVDSYKDFIFWDFIKQKQYVDGSPVERITGRVAYVVVTSGELFPYSVVESGLNEKDWLEHRIGREINEINIQSVNSTLIPAGVADKFNFDILATPNGKQPVNGWTDYPTMFSDLGITVNSTKFDYKKWFILGEDLGENESYWLDRKRDTKVENVTNTDANYEMYQRFNLSGTSANVIDVDSASANDYNQSTDDLNIWRFINNNPSYMRKFILLDFDDDGFRSNSNAREFPPKWVNYDDYTPSDGTTAAITDLNTQLSFTAPTYYDQTTPDGSAAFRIPGLLWLANFGTTAANGNDETLKASFPNVTARRQQIAANLVDYSDADSIPTSDVPATTWGNVGASVPTFTGNEKTPYINEVFFLGTFAISMLKYGGTPANERRITLSFDVDCGGEVIDMYGCAFSGTPYVTLLSVTGSIDWSVDGGTPTTIPFSYTHKNSNVSDWTSNGYGNIPVIDLLTNSVIVYDGNKTSMPDLVSIEGFKVDSATLLFNDGSGNVDYVKINASESINNTASFTKIDWDNIKTNDAANGVETIYQTFEADDPRQNLNTGDWRMDYVNYSTFTPGKNVNAITDISGTQTNYDQEPLAMSNAYFPAYSSGNKTVSTAFIRNRPMISPWELGFIHRGAKWQTINLKKYNTSYAVSAIPSATGNATSDSNSAFNIGGGAYADGDANILDQVKMTSNATSPTKVNIKVKKAEILKALLNKLSIGSNPSDFENKAIASIGGTELTSGQVDSIYIEIRDNATANIKNAITRAQLANVPLMTSTSNATNDARKEELIGKVINLTKASDKAQYFTVIIVAQSIRDVGGNGTTVSITKTDVNGANATPKGCKLGVFDYINGSNDNDKTNDIAFDEILSTTKIMVRLNVSESGEVKVVSYQYVN